MAFDSKNHPPKCSVLVTTYNHEGFISQALESVLMQEVNFEFEIIVGEDCSSDRTRDIVTKYHECYADKIRVILPEKNLGFNGNKIFERQIEAAKGQYIALLDGDDYWTAPHKLQVQVEYLDKHPECAICFHNAKVVHEDEGGQEAWLWNPAGQREVTTLEDILMDNYIATCTTMFRRGLIGSLPDWYRDIFAADWALHILNAEHGKIAYINEVMGVYRYHQAGLYSPLSPQEKQLDTLKFLRQMNIYTAFKYDRIIRTGISKYFIDWTEEYLKQGDIGAARQAFKFYLTGRPINKYVSFKRMIKLFRKLYLPKAPIGTASASRLH